MLENVHSGRELAPGPGSRGSSEPRTRRSRLVVIANRLPVTQTEGDWRVSPGGLVSALSPILQGSDGCWIGWPGTSDLAPDPFRFDGMQLMPVELTADEVKLFYQGFSNSSLWPLYHDAVRWPEFHRRWWRVYSDVNERFAAAAASALGPGDAVWVHDYHLQLVPSFLRKMHPRTRSGFFLHIPFPPVELFAQLPWRRQILEGLLGADLIGFQTRHGAQNFLRAARRFTPARGSGPVLEFEGRQIQVEAFPISIDVGRFQELASSPAVQAEAEAIRENLGHRKIILGVDRLDYTKGIDRRLRAFETLLGQSPERERLVFFQIAVPSRELVPEYMEMRTRIEQQVGHINGAWGTSEHIPVHYQYRSLDAPELVAHYLAADVMAVTPLRDGMNLVAKEYVSTQLESKGVLILSEFAGAARELKQALLVNPHDVDGMANAMELALAMSEGERRRRMNVLRRTVGKFDVHLWAESFLSALCGDTST